MKHTCAAVWRQGSSRRRSAAEVLPPLGRARPRPGAGSGGVGGNKKYLVYMQIFQSMAFCPHGGGMHPGLLPPLHPSHYTSGYTWTQILADFSPKFT